MISNLLVKKILTSTKRTPAARHTSFLFMLASEQVCLASRKRLEVNTYEMVSESREADSKNEVELKMVRFARHGTNEVCGVKCKSAVFYGTELSNPQSSSIGEMYRGNILEGISLPQAASRFSSRNMQIE